MSKKTERKIFACECRDYDILLDGKKFVVSGERLVGCIFDDDAKYFEGAVFDKRDFGYELGGTVELSKKEFQERVSSFSEMF